MGRIIIFTIDSCSFCHRVKKELQHRCLPFVEIPVDCFPERKVDMFELSGKMTVPQIFMNTRWIGGCDELIKLLDTWDSEGDYWQRYLEEVARQPDPVDYRLSHPMTPLGLTELFQSSDHHRDPSATGGDECFVDGWIPLPGNPPTRATFGEVTSILVQEMPREKLAYLAKYYQDCFTGCQGVDALMQIFPALCPSQDPNNAEDRLRAVGFGNLLMRCGIMHHVANHHQYVDTKDYYYRLQPFHQPYLLNSFLSQQQVSLSLTSHMKESSTFRPEEDTSSSGPNTVLSASGALKLLTNLQRLLSDIETRATGRDGIDFLATKDYSDPAFIQLEEGSCRLQCMDGICLASTMTDAEKTVFGIHLYNTMVRHAQIKVGLPTTASQRRAFFTGVKYKVANQILSLDDVEHGFLRANTRHPYHVKQQFLGDDARRAWTTKKLDPRIHFTLWCGAKSCPQLNEFSVENLDEQLQLASESFCLDDNNVVVDENTNTLTLSMIFKWYKSDFGCASSKDLPEVVLGYLPEGSEKHAALSAMIIQSKTPGSYSPGQRRFTRGMPRSSSPDMRSKPPDNRETWGGKSTSQRTGDGVKVKFIPYDWAPQAAPGKFATFTRSNLKTTETSLRAPFSKRAIAGLTMGGMPSNFRNKSDRKQ
ncbi:Glutaredoxin 3 [Seminavis robusta]|uniref:Glutaredoxin 3 n=1 Tax=Seminavis robusta TaxID=568900 RepID=A0A9N8ENJ7_9STRA|nr:Glutaredoxin 3 [Seminavis robusta]|eukprot:Sro1233_g254820.1 Glutaredoxin 3 (648) ;mRNA; r:20957-22900